MLRVRFLALFWDFVGKSLPLLDSMISLMLDPLGRYRGGSVVLRGVCD